MRRGQHIILIDGHKLAQLMIEHGFGVSTRKIYEIKPWTVTFSMNTLMKSNEKSLGHKEHMNE